MGPNKQNGQFGSSGPVMDIQRPSGQPDVIRPSSPLGRPATMEYTRPRPDSPTSPARSFSPESPVSDDSIASAQPVVKAKKSKKGLIIGLLLFLVVGGAAASGAYYYFMMRDDAQPQPVATEPVAPVEETTTIEATPEGVDKTVQTIDTNLNGLNDTTDFTPNDVSDDALGL